MRKQRNRHHFLPLPERKPTGIWGQRYRHYLKEHRSATYTAMFLSGTLDNHVAEIDRQAKEMLDRLTKQMAAQEGVTEQLKASDQMAWVGAMNSTRARLEIFSLSITGGKLTPAAPHRLAILFKTACER